MPMIAMTTSVDLTGKEDVLKAGFGRSIALLGKSDAYLMISLTGGTPMYFQGEAREAAFLDVSCFGKGTAAGYETFTAAACDLLEQTLGLSPANIYIKYSETAHWGWNGANL